MPRGSDDELADKVERDMRDETLWEPLDRSIQPRRGALGTQVTIRLEPTHAARLRRIAEDRGLGYTSLLREWIQERLAAEERLLIERTMVQAAGSALTYTASAKNLQTNFQHTVSRRQVIVETAA